MLLSSITVSKQSHYYDQQARHANQDEYEQWVVGKMYMGAAYPVEKPSI